MKAILSLTLLFAGGRLWADEVADRAAIEKVIAADAKGAERTELECLDASNRPWSEVTAPRIVTKSIQFTTPDVAVVEATNTQYGSVILVRRIPVVFVMKRQGKDWRITSVKADCTGIDATLK